jgi:hypothetical protein
VRDGDLIIVMTRAGMAPPIHGGTPLQLAQAHAL